jgi:hypothetical protein
MPAATTDTELQASATNSAGGTTTGSWVNVSATYGGEVAAKVTNGATGPTLPCEFYLDTSPDNGTTVYAQRGYGKAGVANDGVYTFFVPVPFGTRYIRTRFTGNTAQSVTVQADLQAATGV